MSKDTFYFSHDYNTRSDIKVKDLIAEHGMIGYGVFWAIIEDLYNNANALPLKYKTISYELRVDENIVKSIINDFELFEIKEDYFGSLSVQRRLDERNSKSKKARESALKRWEKNESNANALETQSTPNAIKERKGKENKVNESIDILLEKETKYTNTDFKNDLINYGFKENLVIEWLQVRKTKKATNSKTAFNKFIKQVELNGNDKNFILETCVAKSWSGFEADYNLGNVPNKVIAPNNQVSKQIDPLEYFGYELNHDYNVR